MSNKEISNNFLFVDLPFYIVIALPFLLVTGPFLADLAVSFIAINFIFYCFFDKNYKYFNNIYFKLFLLFNFFIWLITLLNLNNYESFFNLKTPIFYFRFGFFSLAIWHLIENKKSFFINLYWSILLIFLILIVDSFFQFFFQENIIGLPKKGSRLSSFFGDELILGSYLSRMFPIFLFLTIFINEKKKIYISLFTLILVEVLIFISGERSAFFYINLATLFFIILVKNFKKLKIIIFSSSILLIILISVFNQSVSNRMIKEPLNSFGLVNSERIYVFSKLHETYYKTALNIFKDNPIKGVGVRNYRNFCSDKKYRVSGLSCSTHPHNTYMELLSETGILGFLFIFLIFMILVYYSFKHFLLKFKGKFFFTDSQIALLSSVFINLWPLIPTGSFFNNWLNCLYYFPLGILLWSLLNNSTISKN